MDSGTGHLDNWTLIALFCLVFGKASYDTFDHVSLATYLVIVSCNNQMQLMYISIPHEIWSEFKDDSTVDDQHCGKGRKLDENLLWPLILVCDSVIYPSIFFHQLGPHFDFF